MKYTNKIFKKNAVIEEYLPLLMKSPLQVENAGYVIYSYGDNSLLEITFDEKNHNVYKICMVICKAFRRINTSYTLPEEVTEGDISVDTAQEIVTNKFECDIYDDAIRISLSDVRIAEHIASDNILWDLDEAGNLAALTVYGQASQVVQHAFDELSYDSKVNNQSD